MFPDPNGGNGNNPLTTALPLEPTVTNQHYLQDNDPRLMMGGAGGNGQDPDNTLSPAYALHPGIGGAKGGNGGGIVVLDFTSINGTTKTITANGANGQANGTGTSSGSGGGAGGQMLLRAATVSNLSATARGGDDHEDSERSHWVRSSGCRVDDSRRRRDRSGLTSARRVHAFSSLPDRGRDEKTILRRWGCGERAHETKTRPEISLGARCSSSKALPTRSSQLELKLER